MPRKPRQHSPINIYHIVVKGVNSQLLFEERKDYLNYLEIIKYYKEDCQFDLLAYCLMSNHIHLLINTNGIPLDTIFRKINTAYANWFNMKYNRSGPLQDGRYYSEPINSLNYFLSALRYIHKNPQKAYLEESIGSKYPWNSYHAYITNNNSLVNISIALSFFNSLDDFLEFHKKENEGDFIDLNNLRKRVPDNVAIETIKNTCNVNQPTDVSSFPLLERKNAILTLKEKGISSRQINRLTGIPRGIVDRIIKNAF